MGFMGKIRLSSFNNAEIIEVPRDDRLVKGIFIPFEENSMYVDRKGNVDNYICCVDKKPNLYGQSHYIKLSTSGVRSAELRKKGFTLPIIGYLRPSSRFLKRQRFKKNIDDVLSESR